MNTISELFTARNAQLAVRERRIAQRTAGRKEAWFTRLASPSDIGELIKPFVFLDNFDVQSRKPAVFGMHPHSGIATLTLIFSGNMEYQDSTGQSGVLAPGSVEWMSAGGGVWHGGDAALGERVRGFQLWIALPPEEEDNSPHSIYLSSQQMSEYGPARVILGSYGGVTSLITTAASMNYLHVKLQHGHHWSYQPPAGHTIAWVALRHGALRAADSLLRNELVVFEESTGTLEFTAEGDTEFVLGSAVKHPHQLEVGTFSVHTNPTALARGEKEIKRLGEIWG